MSKEKQFIIIAFIVIAVVLIVTLYAVRPFAPKYEIGVKAGDTFTYQMTGVAESSDFDMVIPENYMDVNRTSHYRIEITKVSYPLVSYIETTLFKNGTIIRSEATLNVESGATTGEGGFWGIFVTNLGVGKLSRPAVTTGITVNATEIRQYQNGDRQTNFMTASAEFVDVEDETYSRTCTRFTYIHVDKEIGIMVELSERQIYNDPQIMLTTTWTLIESNVLQVS